MKKLVEKYTVYFILGMTNFFVTFLVLAPVLHEAFHVISLRAYGCKNYELFMQFNLMEGVSGSIEYFQKLGVEATSIILLSGILGNLLIGSILMEVSFVLAEKSPPYSIMIGLTACGFLFDSVLYFFFEMDGDIVRFFKLVGIKNSWTAPFIGSVLFLFTLYSIIRLIETTSEYHIYKIHKASKR